MPTVVIYIWLDGDGELSEIQEGRVLRLSGAEDRSKVPILCREREEENGL